MRLQNIPIMHLDEAVKDSFFVTVAEQLTVLSLLWLQALVSQL